MNKKKMIVDKYNTVYSFDVYVVLNPSKDELDKLFKWSESDNIKSEKNDNSIYDDKNKKYSAYSCIGVIDKSNGRRCFVVIINNIGTDELYDINTASHEAFHITMDLLGACDMQYSEDNCEAYAYLQGYITEYIYKTSKKEWAS